MAVPTPPASSSGSTPDIFEATRATDGSGAVDRGKLLTRPQAEFAGEQDWILWFAAQTRVQTGNWRDQLNWRSDLRANDPKLMARIWDRNRFRIGNPAAAHRQVIAFAKRKGLQAFRHARRGEFMKFFTPELFVSLQECNSPDEFRAGNAKWEIAVQKYGSHLKIIAPRLTGGIRQFFRHGSLHDARVIAIGTAERQMSIVVQEELVPTLLSLTYSLVDDAMIERESFAKEHRATDAVWLYDEIEIESRLSPGTKVRRTGTISPSQSNGKKTVYRHSILLSNGWEIRLRFDRLNFARTTSLLRTNDNGNANRSQPSFA
jgi:hypothetical protein